MAQGTFGQAKVIGPAAGLMGALPPGVTARFDLLDYGRRMLSLDVSRPALAQGNNAEIDIGLLVDSAGTPPDWDLAAMELTGQKQCFVLLIPTQLSQTNVSGVAALVQTSPGTSAVALAAAMRDVDASVQRVAAQPKVVPVDPPDWPGLSSAIQSLVSVDRQRAALNFLAQQTDARLTENVTLTADPSVLAQLAAAVVEAMKNSPQARDRASVGWVLEWTTLQLLMRIENGGKLPPELAAVLAVYAGEVGRNPATLEQVARGVRDSQDLKNRLAEENFNFLDDSSPAARMRAYDWLASRGLAPAGYDPLGSPVDRRKALDAAEESADQGAPPQTTTNISP